MLLRISFEEDGVGVTFFCRRCNDMSVVDEISDVGGGGGVSSKSTTNQLKH